MNEEDYKTAFGDNAQKVESEWLPANPPPERWSGRPWEWAYSEMCLGRMLIGRTFIYRQDENGPNFGGM